MAFESNVDFRAFLCNDSLQSSNEAKAVAENFILEERLSSDREISYASTNISSLSNFDLWKEKHNDYYYEKLKYPETPETFTESNKENFCVGLESESFFLRIDTISEKVCSGLGIDVKFMFKVLESYFIDKKDEWKYLVEKYYAMWNNIGRDNRPVFVTFFSSVESILNDSSLTTDRKLSTLRDMLGLTHYVSGRMLILHKYAVKDVLKNSKDNDSLIAIPTVLDTDLNPIFFPSPKKRPNGMTVQCCKFSGDHIPEIIHKKFDLNTSHFFNLGTVSENVSVDWFNARNTHKNMICDEFCNNL